MPLIDVSDLLSDPDFADTFSATRYDETVGSNGRATFTPTAYPCCIGVVSPSNTNELNRLPEGSRIEGAITIRTVLRLSPGDPNGQPADTVQWGGATYTVRQTNDWSHFGAGFIEAVCTRNPLA